MADHELDLNRISRCANAKPKRFLEAREAGKLLVSAGKDAVGCEIFVFVNNRLEGKPKFLTEDQRLHSAKWNFAECAIRNHGFIHSPLSIRKSQWHGVCRLP